MPKEPSLLGPDDIRLLTQIGFIAAGQADVPRAERIFGALSHVRPDRAFAHVGPAMALLNAGRAAEAAQQLLRALPQLAPGEDADTVSAVCALALQLEGRTSESTRLLRDLLHNAAPDGDNDGLRLARRMLGEPQAPASPPPLSP
ncbi:hypothetical protein [Acidovorax sp.]|uniref:hypothetical protein n=1 Tax=Acidovorax sp. TaxID=1872122 RepID=UPI003CFF9C65